MASEKQAQANQLIISLAKDASSVISTQVLQEFYVNAKRKLSRSDEECKQFIRQFRRMDIVTVTPDLIEQAIDTAGRYQINFWDALILVSALFANCSTLYTEDLQHAARLHGIRIVNPFAK